MKRKLVFFFLNLVLVLPAIYGQADQPMIGETAPSFVLKDLGGKTYSLADYKGKILLVHFATTWCPFCNAEAPNLEKINQEYKDKGVQVLIIDVKEGKELIQRSFERFNFTFPVLLDENGKVAASYAPAGVLPDLARDEVVLASNLVIDREGKIRFYSLLNTTSFDAKLIQAREKLDELLGK